MKTLAFVLCLALPALAQDDAPRAVRLDDGSVKFNPAAYKKLDEELKRLQAVERQHKDESWVTVVAVSAGVGFLVGVVVTGIVILPVVSASQAK